MLEFSTFEGVAVISVFLAAITSIILVLMTIYREQKGSQLINSASSDDGQNSTQIGTNTKEDQLDKLTGQFTASEFLLDASVKFNLITQQMSKWLTNSILLLAWAAANLLIEYAIGRLHPAGFYLVVIRLSQIIFLAATLAPVLLYFYLDTRELVKKAQQIIRPKSELDPADVTRAST